MPVGSTAWKVCLECGRRYLAINKQGFDYPEAAVYCPRCRAKKVREKFKKIADKWLQ